MHINDKGLVALKNSYNDINIIDVGSAYGSFMDLVKTHKFGKVFGIGIDPVDRDRASIKYDIFINCALDNVENDTEQTFYVNGGDPQASSLLMMDFDKLTQNTKEKENKIYLAWANRLHLKESIKVNTKSLKSVMDQYIGDKTVHFLKIDAEGKDLDIVKSAGELIRNCIYVSIECGSHKNKNLLIYKNGCHKSDFIEYMATKSFEVDSCDDYEFVASNGTQMSDIVFKNKKF